MTESDQGSERKTATKPVQTGTVPDSASDKAFYLLAKSWWALLLGIGVVVFLVVIDFIDFPSVPPWFWPLSQALVVGGAVGILLGKWVVNHFFPDPRNLVTEIGFDEETGSVDVLTWVVSDEQWAHRADGERPPLRPDRGNNVAVVTDFDWDSDHRSLSVEGCNPELSNPISLAARQGMFEATRSDLVQEAERADRLEQTLELRALEMQRENARAILAAIETGSQMSPGAVSRIARGNLKDAQFRADQRERIEDQNKQLSNGHEPEQEVVDVEQ